MKQKLLILLMAVLSIAEGARAANVEINATNFPDATFRTYVSDNFDSNTDGFLSDAEIAAVKKIDFYMSVSGVTDVTGIQFFTALTYLDCCESELTSLDVSKNTKLETLWCDNNKLTTLDVSKNTALTKLGCYKNQLTALDVSKNTALEELWCYDNQLTALDVSMNTALTKLYCWGNNIRGAGMATLVNSLVDRSSTALWGALGVYTTGTADGNEMTTQQVAAAKAKNWQVLMYNDSGLENYPGVYYGIAIDATNFPDEKFRTYVSSNFDSDNNGFLSDAEIAAAKEVIVYNKGISDLTGIEYFTALEFLDCHNNQLTALDVSKNTALKNLRCNGNQLTALDVSKNTALTLLLCNNNKLTALDVSKNTALGVLYCSSNQLTVLDVSKNAAFGTLECSDNQLTALDVSKNTALKNLECSLNQLTALDVSKNTQLEQLFCYGNQLTILDVSKNTALQYLCCYGNKIRGAGMATLVNSLCNRSSMSQGKLLIYNDETPVGNEITIPQVAAAKAKNWLVQMKNGSTWVDYPGVDPGVAINATNFPDAKFRAYVSSSFDTDKDEYLSDAEIAAVKKIDVCNKDISNLKGIEHFTALTELRCNKNQLSAFNLSKNTALECLDCDDNQLTTLDVSKNTALKELYCNGNQLTALDVSNNTALEYLQCYGNQLTTLDVSKNTALLDLQCYYNKLTTLDVSTNKKLTQVVCFDNCIRDEGMKAFVNSLYDRSATTQGYLRVYDYELATGNEMTIPQVEAAKAKNWQVLMYDSDAEVWVDYPGVAPGPAIDATNFPDAVFRTYVSNNCDPDKDGYLSKEEIAGVKEITISNKGVTSLKGVEHFTALYYLSCYYNKLTTLDVSKNTALEYLYCYNNQLTALDVSKNTALKNLKCYKNQLTTLDVSKNKKLTQLHCYGNAIRDDGMQALVSKLYNRASTSAGKLYVYNKETATGNMMTAEQVATAKGKNWQVLLASGEDWVDYPGGMATVTLSKPEVIVKKKKTVTLTATLYPETLTDKSVTWESSDESIATVTADGVVKGVKSGVVTITCTSNATAASATCQVTVATISLDKSEAVVKKKSTITLTPTVYPSTLEDKSVKWKSSDKTIATVSSAGVVKGVKSGVVTITCTSVATGVSTTCKVTVGTITLNKSSVTVDQGKTVTLTPTVYPSTLEDKTVKWKSSDKSVATVTSAGKVKGVKAGVATITCTSNATGLSTTCTVTVPGVALDQTEVILKKKKTLTLTPTFYPETLEDKSVTWKSSDKTIATVSSAGKVTGVKSGVVTITCTSKATGLSATCKVTVATITLDQSEVIVRKKNTVTLTPTVYPTSLEDKSVTWKSSDESVARVSSDGVVTGVKSGFVTITCTSNATGLSATCKVTVGTITLSKSSATLVVGKTLTLTPTVYPTTLEDQSVTWKSSKTSVAKVSSKGKVTAVAAGTATITCTSVATGLSTTCKITVKKSASARTIDGDDAELTDIEIVEETPAAEEPFDVYDLKGHRVLHQVTSLDGLPAGVYIVNGKKVLKK